jgi:two-component system, chemotaxis family, chemotaxis protein CheY
MKVLVVDDSAAMRRSITNALQRIGYADVIEASNGRDALTQVDETIGLIITDWNMPAMNGVELTRAVRAGRFGQSVPIMLVTTRGARDDIIAAIEAGVTSYILKPVTPSVLREKIERVLANTGVAA